MVKKSKAIFIYLLTFLTVASGFWGSVTPSIVRADANAFRDDFNHLPVTATVTSLPGWDFQTKQNGSYGFVSISNNVREVYTDKNLKLTDDDVHAEGHPDEYRAAPTATRTFAAQTGKFALETRIRIEKYNFIPSQHFNMVVLDNSTTPKVASKIAYGSGVWKYHDSDGGIHELPPAHFFGEWTTIRLSFDVPNGTYDLTVISDAYKHANSNETSDPAGHLDLATGTYTVRNIDLPAGIGGIVKARYFGQKYGGAYSIDYLALDNDPPGWSNGTLGVSNQTKTGVTLSWQGTTTPSGGHTLYHIYDGSAFVGTAAGNATSTTLHNIAPGSHTFAVRAVDAMGNVSLLGPNSSALQFPRTLWETFQDKSIGTFPNDPNIGWAVSTVPGGSVDIAADPVVPTNRILKITDNDYTTTQVPEFQSAAIVERTVNTLANKFILETKVRIDQHADTPSQQHFNVVTKSGNTEVSKIVFSGGLWRYVSGGTSTPFPSPPPSTSFLGKWTTIRIAFDFGTPKKYEITLVSDAYVTPSNPTGTVTVGNLPIPAGVASITKAGFFPQKYKGYYLIDDLTLDDTPPIWAGTLTVKDKRATSAKLSWPAATNDIGDIAEYVVYDGNTELARVPGHTREYTAQITTYGTHAFRVEAIDTTGHASTGGPSANVPFPDIANIQMLLPPNEHPRLLLQAADLPALRARVAHADMSDHWGDILTLISSTSASDGSLPARTQGKTNYNENLLYAIEARALKYVLFKDVDPASAALGRPAVDMMKNYLNTLSHIPDDSTLFSSQVGNVLTGGAMVYDWCYALLSEAEKQFFIEKFIKLAKETTLGFPTIMNGGSYITGRGSSHYIPNDLLSVGVAIYDETDEMYVHAAKLVQDKVVPSRNFLYNSHMPYNGDSYGQTVYAYDAMAKSIFARMGDPNPSNASDPFDHVYDNGKLSQVPYRTIYMRTPDDDFLRDGDTFTVPVLGGHGHHLPNTFLYSAGPFGDPYFQSEFDRQYDYTNWQVNPIHVALFYDPALPSEPLSELPLTRYFDSPVGSMVARTGWDLDTGTTAAARSSAVVAEMKVSEYHFNNHNHLDTGAFQIYYKGSLALDSGVYSDFNSPHSKNYQRRTIAHNSMLIRKPNDDFKIFGETIANDGGVKFPNGGQEPHDLGVLTSPAAGYKTSQVAGMQFGPDPIAPDYSYLKGDLTNAYDGRVSKYTRSFVFLNLKNTANPAALIVYDRVNALDANFEKFWLLHSQQEPAVDKNVTTITRDGDGYNGKLVNATLLPKFTEDAQNNLIIQKISGANVFGADYSFSGTYNSGYEPGNWRVQISPDDAAQNDQFLNVMQVMDAGGTPLPVTRIESPSMVGAAIRDRVVLFSNSGDRLAGSITFTVPSGSSPTLKILATDLAKGTWQIARPNQAPLTQGTVTEKGGALDFTGPAGPYTLTWLSN